MAFTYTFIGDAPEEFPTLSGELVEAGRADAFLEPGDQITLEHEIDPPHARLELVTAPPAKTPPAPADPAPAKES